HERNSLTLSYSIAEDHALKGPELISRITSILKELPKGRGYEFAGGLEKFYELREKYSQFMESHLPVILYIIPKKEDIITDYGDITIFSKREEVWNALNILNSTHLNYYQTSSQEMVLFCLRENNPNWSVSDLLQYYNRAENYIVITNPIPPNRIVGYDLVSQAKNIYK
ncbi:MAG: hypothetical protein AABY14_02030, partial [Nanoarchaeota archaeon]